MNLLIGIDLGTTGVRSIVYNEKLVELGQSYFEYPLIHLAPDKIEQDASLWWDLVKKTMFSAMINSGCAGSDVVSISVSSQGIAFLAVDDNCDPIMNAISWLDNRATIEAEEIISRYSERKIYEITGKRTNGVYVLPKLMWIKKNCSDIYENTAYFLMAHDFIIAKLCGRYVTDYTMASGTLMYDINSQEWSDLLLQQFGIDKSKLPKIAAAGSAAGTIISAVAEELGINKNAIVVIGGQDQKCAALGAGISENSATISLGTAAAIMRKWDKPVFDEMMRIPCFSNIIKNSWVTEGVLSTAASSLKWLKEAFFLNQNYSDLDKLASSVEIDDLLFFPHLAGSSSPNWYGECCGCFYGIHLSTLPGNLILALLEGVAFQIRQNIEVMQDSHNPITHLIVFGGGSNSRIWCETIANVTGLPVNVPMTVETACLGAAILAGLGAGIYSNLEESQSMITIAKKYYPDNKKRDIYDCKYSKYLVIEKKLWDK